MGVPSGSDISPGGEECDHGAQPAGGSLKGCRLGVGPFSKGLKGLTRAISSWGFIPGAEEAPERWGVTSLCGHVSWT